MKEPIFTVLFDEEFWKHRTMKGIPVSERSFLELRWVRWLGTFFIWTSVGLFFASQALLWDRYIFREPITWERALTLNLTFYYIWGVFSPIVLWLGKKFQLERKSLSRSLIVHIPTSIFFATIQLLLAEAVFQSIRPYPLKLYEAFQALQFSFAFNFHINLVTYWIILGIGYGRDYYKKFRDRELRASQLETQLSQAQLQALKMQLHPHFFFNTLNTISSLMHKDVHDADRVLARLGDLLRYSLRNVGIQEVTLKEELEFLQRYLEIEQIRFGERLKVQIMIDQALSEAKVPNLILQPLVENAIRYAVGPRTSGGNIEISALRVNGNLELSVKDNGPGLPEGYQTISSEGVGLRNTRERLQQLYGDQHEFKLTSKPQGGLNVSVTLPFHTT